MKKIILLFLIVGQSVLGQIKYIESDSDSYVNFTNNTVKLNFNEYSIEGTFVEMDGKDYYSYMVVNGGENVWIIRNLSQLGIMGMDILKGDYETIVKEFKKGRRYKKSELLFSSLPAKNIAEGFRFISEYEKERNDKRNKSIIKFDSEISESQYLGVYKIKIFKHRNMDYKAIDTFGKLIITEAGITMETEIPSLSLLRGTYDKGSSDVEKGQFSCTISKGYGEIFTLILNKEKTIGGLSTMSGRNSTTTTFSIID